MRIGSPFNQSNSTQNSSLEKPKDCYNCMVYYFSNINLNKDSVITGFEMYASSAGYVEISVSLVY